MKLRNLVVLVVGAVILAGCVTVEGVKEQLGSGDPQIRAKAEEKVHNIALCLQNPLSERIAFMQLLDNDKSRLQLMTEAAKYRQYDILVHTFVQMELNDQQLATAAIICLRGGEYREDSTEGKMILEKLKGMLGGDQKSLLLLIKNNVEWHRTKAYWIAKFLYEKSAERLLEISDNQRVLCMLYSGFKYGQGYNSRFENDIVGKALSKITDKDLLWRSYTNGINNINQVFHKRTAEKLGEEYCVARLCEVPESEDFGQRTYYPIFEGVKSQDGLADVVIRGKCKGIVSWAEGGIVDDAAFVKIFKAGKGSRKLAYQLGVVKDKETFTRLLKLTEDKKLKDLIIEQGLKVGWDPSVNVLNEKEYSKSLLDCLFCIAKKDSLREIAERHSLPLIRYYAWSKVDKKNAEKLAQEEAARYVKRNESVQKPSVQGLRLDMNLSDAFFLVKKVFPEEKFEIKAEGSYWSISVVGEVDFARAHYEDNKIYWMNFTPSMVRSWVGGAESSVTGMVAPVAKKLGVEMGHKQIKAKMYFDHDLLDALCDEKYPPAFQMGLEAIMTNGDVVRYFTHERTESLAIVPILCLNDTFRNLWKVAGSDPEYEARKAVRNAANNLGWILAAPGTLRFLKPISDNGF